MKFSIAHQCNRLLESMGFEIRRKSHFVLPFHFLETILYTVLSYEGNLNIVQVGANDGLHGDPIHNFMMKNKEFTNALLIEPQKELIAYLKDSYATHPSISIYNGAIGAEESLMLYRINPKFWNSFHTPYLKEAPDYRAPSGITSAHKEHVTKSAKKYLDRKIDIDDAIDKIRTPCKRLPELLSTMHFPANIHLLQIDVEGADDQVIFASDIDKLRPKLINFESKNLTQKNRYELEKYLSSNGYKLYQWNDSDTLAMRRNPV